MPGRKYSAVSGYRYGFNGKENDNEVKRVEGSQQDYGMRIYDPRLGKFLSVDPLTKDFPWYTPYQFAGNKPINSIDLDGMEELTVIEMSKPFPGAPGSALIIITMDYLVVEQGIGRVTNAKDIDPNKISNEFKKGNTTLRLMNLPTSKSKAVPLSRKHERWAKKSERGNIKYTEKLNKAGIIYYKTSVEYNVSVSKGNYTLSDAQLYASSYPHRFGIIAEQFTSTDPTLPFIKQFTTFVNRNNPFVAGKNIEGIASNEKVFGFANNILMLNPSSNTNGTTTNVVHEIGHNMAFHHHHSNVDYKPDKFGLQNNVTNATYPSNENTLNIINDETNRSTINGGPLKLKAPSQ